MNRVGKLIIIIMVTFLWDACVGDTQNKQHPTAQIKDTSETPITYHSVYSDDTSENCKCPMQFDLRDSSKLIHIKDQFYKSGNGHLYEKTWSLRKLKGRDTLSEVLYFNGYLSQEVDPLTFEPLDGWYAKDKNFVYYYRPVSGGMQISKIDNADTKTFKLLAGHYKYGMDKNFFYDEPEIIEGFVPSKTNLKLDNKGRAIKMTCNRKAYTFELVN